MSELLYYDLKDSAGVSPSLATHVCRELGRRIVGGVHREGELIDDEGRLGERFCVSKSVIREAIKLLVGKGLLEVRRGSGTRVRRRASWNLLDDDVLAWHLSTDPRPDFLRQLTEFRRVIEPSAASWAAKFGTEDEHAEIESAQVRMETGEQSIEEYRCGGCNVSQGHSPSRWKRASDLDGRRDILRSPQFDPPDQL